MIEEASDPPVATAPVHGDLNQSLIESDWWTDEMVQHAGIPIVDAPLVTIGGGLGSYTLADTLRIAGWPANQIRVLTDLDWPLQTYRYLCRTSQVPDHERLRSDSSSVLDNIWGWPSYALREAFAARSLQGFIAPLFQVL